MKSTRAVGWCVYFGLRDGIQTKVHFEKKFFKKEKRKNLLKDEVDWLLMSYLWDIQVIEERIDET